MKFLAGAMEVQVGSHLPNRMPFSGVITRIGSSSDSPPHGSGGKNVLVTLAAATAAVDTMVGMGVNVAPGFDEHRATNKVGVITKSWIEGDALMGSGILYDNDFPRECAEIKANKDLLGFSFEADHVGVVNKSENPWVVSHLVFTGASILLKDKAAYTTTSLAASKDILHMDAAEIAQIVAAAVAPLNAQLTEMRTKIEANANTMALVEPHAKQLESCADSMQAASIGNEPNHGHVAMLRKMAGGMRAAAAVGKVPHSFSDGMYAGASTVRVEDTDAYKAVIKELGEVKTSLAASNAELGETKTSLAAAREKVVEPTRSTGEQGDAKGKLQASTIAILEKTGIGMPTKEGEMIDPNKFSKECREKGMSSVQIMAAKSDLAARGLMA